MTTQMFDEPILTAADEVLLARAIEAGVFAAELLRQRAAGAESAWSTAADADLRDVRKAGEEASARLVRANLRLVAMVTMPTASKAKLDGDDLFQEGVLGLLEAIRRFDHTRSVRFATFALPWIRMKVGECAITRSGEVDLPASRARAWVQVVAARDALVVACGRRPSLHEISEAVGRPIEVVRTLLAYVPTTRLPDAASIAGVLREAPRASDRVSMQRLLRALPREERAAIDLLYGLVGGVTLTYEEAALRLEISKSTVRRREKSALVRLRGVPALSVA